MAENGKINRRRFLHATAPAAAFTIIPRRVLAASGDVAPSDKITIGFTGVGTQGIRQLLEALPNPNVQIVAVCDPNTKSNDYVGWGKHEIRDKVREFLKNPTWGEGVEGCSCGRLIGKEIIETYYSNANKGGAYQGCREYADYRVMLDKESDLDAVYIMTPDHHHASIAMAAMKKGKHAITHKSLANYFQEVKKVVETARQTQKATHMFCSSDNKNAALISEWIGSGAIGPVREVHNWSSRPFWPQGMTDYPQEQVPVPEGLDWDLWLGPVLHHSYHPTLTHAVFRGWVDFGAGALGDMGHYSFYQIFKILKLKSPVSVEASRSQYWAIVDKLWKKQINRISFPQASMIRWEFPAREDMPPVALHWYDGGLRPPIPEELEKDKQEMPDEGLLFVGDKGKLLAGFAGDDPKLIPQEKMQAFVKPPETLPRPIGELEQWIRACQGGPESGASFENVYPISETIAMGNIALRIDRKLQWDAEKKEFINAPDANELMVRKYRPGWEL